MAIAAIVRGEGAFARGAEILTASGIGFANVFATGGGVVVLIAVGQIAAVRGVRSALAVEQPAVDVSARAAHAASDWEAVGFAVSVALSIHLDAA